VLLEMRGLGIVLIPDKKKEVEEFNTSSVGLDRSLGWDRTG
jgi:hypothetical protein